jgi:arylsulfatase A-like enzyme/Tfp pilus assembly protein PilF
LRNRLGAAAIGVIGLAAGVWMATRGGVRTSQPIASGALRGYNVLLVTVDTLRADHVGAYGSARGLTPTLDRLASEGLRFDIVYAHVPMTLPSHTTIMTGTLPLTNGVRDNGSFRFDGARPTLAGVLKASGYETAAFVGAFPVDARFGLNAGFDLYDDYYGSRPVGGELSVLERPAEDVLRPAFQWIADHHARWFVWAHLYDPHEPYSPPEPYRSRYASDLYSGEIAYADTALGGMLIKLQQGGSLGHTLIVIASDHGESLGEHGERTHGLFAYDATLRVPLIVWAPPIIRPGTFAPPTRLVDVMPTVLDLIGLPVPAALDGRTVRPFVSGERKYDDPGSYFEALNANLTRSWAPLAGVVQDGVKLIDLPVPELYDLHGDPGEQLNLYARRSDLAKPLERSLDALTARGVKPAAGPVDRDTAQRLQSLGYIVAGPARPSRSFTARDDPKNLIGLQNRLDEALDALKAGRASDAERLLQGIIAERPDFTIAYERLAFIYHETSRLDDAIAILERVSRSGATDAATLATLGGYLQEADRLDRSVAVLEAAQKLNPAEIDAYEKLGVTYTRMKRFADAERQFRQVLSVDPSSAITYNNLGSMFLAAHRDRDAADALSRAVAIDSSLASAHNGLGVAYARQGDMSRAAQEWRKALTLRPDLTDARENLQRIGGR